MRLNRLAAAFVILVTVGACAQGSSIGEGGSGGTGGTSSTGSKSSTQSGSTTSSSTSQSTSVGTTSASTTSSGTTSSGSTSSVSSSSSGVMCGAMQHVCSGMCQGNTIATGCYGSVSCAACPAAPANGTEMCTAGGQCDFSCSPGYNKSGASCVCATQCCSNTDCNSNESCNGGVCQANCDSQTCTATCLAICIIQNKVGFGSCSGPNCNCVCI